MGFGVPDAMHSSKRKSRLGASRSMHARQGVSRAPSGLWFPVSTAECEKARRRGEAIVPRGEADSGENHGAEESKRCRRTARVV